MGLLYVFHGLFERGVENGIFYLHLTTRGNGPNGRITIVVIGPFEVPRTPIQPVSNQTKASWRLIPRHKANTCAVPLLPQEREGVLTGPAQQQSSGTPVHTRRNQLITH